MEIKSSQDNQEIHNDTRTSGSSSIHVGDTGQAIFQKETGTSSTQLSSRPVRLDVPFPKFLSSKGGSRKELARENFINCYNGAKYLLAKYGYCPLVETFILQARIPQSALIRGQDGQLTLSDQVPEGYEKSLKKPFTADSLHMAENLIIKSISKEGDRNMVDSKGRLRPDIPRPVLVGGKDLSFSSIEMFPLEAFYVSGTTLFPKEARENYRNYHTGMDYLVKKYGSRLVNEALVEFKTSCGPYPQLELTRSENDLEQLKPIPPGTEPMLLSIFDDNKLQELENLIVEHGKWENRVLQIAGHIFNVAMATFQTIQAVTSLSGAVTAENPNSLDVIAKVISVTNNVMDDCKLALEIQNDPGSKNKRHILKSTKAALQTIRTAISFSRAMTAENPNSLDTVAKALSFTVSVTNDCQLGLEAIDKATEATIDKPISPPVILGRKEKIVCYADEENIERENFEDFYNAVKYLVKKYGLQSIPADTLKELNALCGGNAPLVLDDQNQLQLPDSVPNWYRRGMPFTMKELTHLENRIVGREGREKLKLALKIGGAITATAGAIASCGAGVTIPMAVTLLKIVYNDVQLVNELLQD
ncbi:MAG: hypothetical protein LBC11_00240 [Puniceicoccales bacterium]|jgi:hypothetical protein|nr:hypothetical protein [Puniceicoccales bacterium]